MNDCGATVFISSPVMLSRENASRLPQLRHRIATGPGHPGYESYETLIDGTPRLPREMEAEGMHMLYSSGTTGRPKAVRKQRRTQPFGAVHHHPLMMELAGITGDDVLPVPGAAVPRRAAGLVARDSPARRGRGAHAALRRRGGPRGSSRAYQASASQFVPTMFVRMLKLAPRRPRRIRPSRRSGRDPRLRPLPHRREVPDDRLVGPHPARVLRRHRGHRHHVP